MLIHAFVYPELAIHSYVIADETANECVVIDPPRIVTPIVNFIQQAGFSLAAICETHVHADFVSGALELKNAFHGKPVIYCSAEGGSEWTPAYADVLARNGDVIELGSVQIKALHTPGHTPEHLSWVCYDLSVDAESPVAAFTGDFLFVQGVGRPDLLGETMKQKMLQELYDSVFKRLSSLPDDVKVLPSHGAGSMCGKAIGNRPTSTLGEERMDNPAFLVKEKEAWMRMIEEDMPAPPKTFARNKKLNLAGAPLLSRLLKSTIVREKSEIQPFIADGGIVDFRNPQDFSQGHFKGAVNVPMSPGAGNWLAAIFPEDVPVLCVIDHKEDMPKILELVRVLGYDNPLSFVLGDSFEDCEDLTEPLDFISADELKKEAGVCVVDVRTPAEWRAGHIPEAKHIQLNQIGSSLPDIPKEKHVVVVCGSGWRSSIAASLLKKEGYKNVSHLKGGMKAWQSTI
jgi:hydroxyacylglutathione hydrolase